MKPITAICVILLFMWATPCLATTLQPCGSFKTVSGKVLIQRQQNTITAATGERLYPRDQIQSGKDGSASIVLQDNTIICVGPDSTMNMEKFIFNPSMYEYSLATRMIKGTFLFLSGIIAKIAPDNVKIQTPDGTIAVRGTRFLVEVL
ncbi:FecR family protein [Desulfocicer vacuolatum DSM 3385]|uniref:FecR family protein n=1 Tax=Desulfocicer vacuolatum DSM 3385 TaxID=1121400 RepID=A0A1W2CH91_9BACT|nr:FecR family protein [Desulfocicer vacuolatum]SMC84569.1 FecR family protein [Desulfocicer vacuolatum DSM 3385]